MSTIGSIPHVNQPASQNKGSGIPIKQVKPIVKLLSARGMNVVDLLKNTSIRVQDLNRIDIEVSPEQHHTLLLNAIEFMPDSSFAADLGEQDFINQDSLLACRVMSSDNVEQAMSLLSRYYKLWTNQFDLNFTSNAQWGIFELSPQIDFGPTLSFYVEYFYAILYSFGKFCLGQPHLPLIFEFSYPAPERLEYHSHFFSETVRFEQATNRVLIPRTLLKQPLIFSDKELARTKDQNCRSIIHSRQSQGSLAQRAKNYIEAAKIEDLNLDNLANALSTSPRSLRRHLMSEGLQFKTLLDQRKQGIALELVQAKELPLTTIAAQLSYQDLSSFSRAFKRWHGQSPKFYQQ